MVYTGSAAKRNDPACSLHYFFSSCAFLPFPHTTACFVLARAVLWLCSKLGTDVDLNLFFFISPKAFLQLKATVKLQHYMLHQKSHQILTIPPVYWRQCCCLFPSQMTSWALMPAQNWPFCFPLLLSNSLRLIVYTWLLLCVVPSLPIDISVWELPPAPAATMNRFPVALSLTTSGSSHSSAANSAFLLLAFIFVFYSLPHHCYTRDLFYFSSK